MLWASPGAMVRSQRSEVRHMKVSLVVATAGKGEGKSIPIPLSPFLIGRDPQCHLRPASPIISKRHCALVLNGETISVRDFNSTNGTFVNSQQIKGEVEVKDGDQLQVGPLVFKLHVEVTAPVNQTTPVPPAKVAAGDVDDELAATLLLDLPDEAGAPGGGLSLDSDGIPQGSTVMEMLPPPDTKEEPAMKGDAKNKEKEKKAPPKTGDTTEAAKAILEKYLRRTRA